MQLCTRLAQIAVNVLVLLAGSKKLLKKLLQLIRTLYSAKTWCRVQIVAVTLYAIIVSCILIFESQAIIYPLASKAPSVPADLCGAGHYTVVN
jgi:hypothetical protein